MENIFILLILLNVFFIVEIIQRADWYSIISQVQTVDDVSVGFLGGLWSTSLWAGLSLTPVQPCCANQY